MAENQVDEEKKSLNFICQMRGAVFTQQSSQLECITAKHNLQSFHFAQFECIILGLKLRKIALNFCLPRNVLRNIDCFYYYSTDV